MVFEKLNKYPSYKKPGVYPSGSLKELGLNNDDLEKFSLGNWNAIVGEKRLFSMDDEIGLPNPKGRPVYIGFDEAILDRGLRRITYDRGDDGNIIPDSISEVMGTNLNGVNNPPAIEYADISDDDSYEVELITTEARYRHFDVWGHYYSGAPSGENINDDWNNREFREERILSLNDTKAFIKERDEENLEAPLVFEFDEGGGMGLTYEREVDPIFTLGYTHELFFPRALRFKNPVESDHYILSSLISAPPGSDFFELDIQDELEDGDEFLITLGAPSFRYNFFLDEQENLDMIIPNIELFLVNTRTENENEFLYYDNQKNLLSYNDTSYPAKVTVNLSLYDYPEFENIITESDSNPISNFFYLDESVDVSEIIDVASFSVENSYFTYQVIQWGDEKNLLSDEQIKNTYFFNLYDVEEYPESDNYYLKKWFASQTREAIPMQNLVSHVYNTPGVKSIKIVVYRYDKSKSFLTQTYLVNKNIVVNDGNLTTQDFSIFGGTDFNFLPTKTVAKSNIEEVQLNGTIQYGGEGGTTNSFFRNPNFDDDVDWSDRLSSGTALFIINNDGDELGRFIDEITVDEQGPLIKLVGNVVGHLTFNPFGDNIYNFYIVEEQETVSYDISQVIVGGLDTISDYNNSVSKIVKDDNFVQEDYLERASSKQYITDFNNGVFGKSPGQLDLSQTRVFTEPRDIYDFIGGDKLEWINQGSGSLPLNSLATDIFIRDDKCVVDLNPANSEFLTIQNQIGTKEQGILVGDYKVNQPKDGKVQRQGVMQTPLLETDGDKQAF